MQSIADISNMSPSSEQDVGLIQKTSDRNVSTLLLTAVRKAMGQLSIENKTTNQPSFKLSTDAEQHLANVSHLSLSLSPSLNFSLSIPVNRTAYRLPSNTYFPNSRSIYITMASSHCKASTSSSCTRPLYSIMTLFPAMVNITYLFRKPCLAVYFKKKIQNINARFNRTPTCTRTRAHTHQSCSHNLPRITSLKVDLLCFQNAFCFYFAPAGNKIYKK